MGGGYVPFKQGVFLLDSSCYLDVRAGQQLEVTVSLNPAAAENHIVSVKDVALL